MRQLLPVALVLVAAGCLDERDSAGRSSGRGGPDATQELDSAVATDARETSAPVDTAAVEDSSPGDARETSTPAMDAEGTVDGGPDGGGSRICTPGATRCAGQDMLVCTPDGSDWDWQPCPEETACLEGDCREPACRGEVCDGRDNDCDGKVDEGLETTRCGHGVCAGQEQRYCVHGEPLECNPLLGAGSEVVGNGLDDDCDGEVDEPPEESGCRLGDEGFVRLTESAEPTHWVAATPDGDGWLVSWTDAGWRGCGTQRLGRLGPHLALEGEVRTFEGLCSAGEGLGVATTGRTDLFTVRAQTRGGSTRGFLGVMDRDGHVLASHPELVEGDRAAVAWQAGTFHAVWSQCCGDHPGVKLASLSAEGQLLRGPRPLPQARFNTGVRPSPLVATDDGLALAWTGRSDEGGGTLVRLLLLDGEGVPRGQPQTVLEGPGSPTEAPALAWAEGRLLAAYRAGDGRDAVILAAVLDAEGRPLGAPALVTDARVARPWFVTATATPTGFVVGAGATVDGDPGFAFWSLSRDGEALGLGPVLAEDMQPGMAVLAPAPDGAIVVFSDCCYEPAGPNPEQPNSEVLAARIVCP